jgi:hypothetical protein
MRWREAVLLTGIALLSAVAVRAAGVEVSFPHPDDVVPYRTSGKPDFFTPDTLWEKIDGEAEQFRRFGLRESASLTYVHPDDPDRRIEVSVYAMESPLLAYGIWSVFRSPGDIEQPIGNRGAVSDFLGFLWHGSSFVTLDAHGPGETMREDLLQMARAVAAKMGEPPPVPAVVRALEGLVDPRVITLVPDHLLEREIMPPGFRLKVQDSEAFVSLVPVDANRLLRDYGKILTDAAPLPWSGREGVTGLDPDLGPITLLLSDDRLAGIRLPAGEVGDAQALVEKLLEMPLPDRGEFTGR